MVFEDEDKILDVKRVFAIIYGGYMKTTEENNRVCFNNFVDDFNTNLCGTNGWIFSWVLFGRN